MRFRFTIWDVAVILAVGCLLLFLAWEFDLFLRSGGQHEAAIELEEALLTALLIGAFVFVAVRRVRAQERELRRRVAAEARAWELAYRDPLTGLANRRQFDYLVAEAVAAPPGADRAHAVLLMDLNGFKAINDAYGHPVGDAVLKEIGARLESAVRDAGDHVARLGGDEFGVVATQLRGPEDAANIALRIIETLTPPVQSEEAVHGVGLGIGIALFPRDGQTAREMVRRADIALYRAKSQAGSQVRFFEEEMDAQIRERTLLESELRHAVAAGDIVPHYQPVIDLATDRISGFEALARWHHPTLGDVPPSRFIPVAEECGLIAELGDQLLRTACTDARDWPSDATLSVNISPVQLRDPAFGLRILAILGNVGFSPSLLEIEITENTLVRDLNVAENALGSLRDAGVAIVLDDFGTGYSSLYHLRNFKVDRIKIDRSFVGSMGEKTESDTIIRALLGLGHGLGVRITAEGIENAEQRAALIGEGCDQGQGFLFSEAVTAADARALLDSRAYRSRRDIPPVRRAG